MPIHSLAVVLAIAFALGVVSGMRSFLAIAILSVTLWRRPEVMPPLGPVTPMFLLTLPPVAVTLALCAVGELVADQLPSIPDRISPGPLIARMITGALSGMLVTEVVRAHAWQGALAGAIGAVIGAFAFYHLRQWAGRVTRIRDPFLGALEDVLALAIAATAVATLIGP